MTTLSSQSRLRRRPRARTSNEGVEMRCLLFHDWRLEPLSGPFLRRYCLSCGRNEEQQYDFMSTWWRKV